MATLRLTLSLALAAAVIAAPCALAQKPPENGAVDQYTEGVPGAEGESPSGGAGGGSGNGGRASVPPEAVAALEAEGSDGEAVLRIAGEAAPTGGGKQGASRANGDEAAPADESGGLLDSVQAAATGEEGGMGIVFPLILGGSLLLALLLLLRARRGAGPAAD